MMATNLFIIANVKQLRTSGSFRILLPFFQTSWDVGILNSAIFNSFHNRVEFGTILEGLRNFGGGGFNPPTPPPTSVRHWWFSCYVSVAHKFKSAFWHMMEMVTLLKRSNLSVHVTFMFVLWNVGHVSCHVLMLHFETYFRRHAV